MEGFRALWLLLVALPFATLTLAAPASDLAKRSLSSLARSSHLPQGHTTQHNGGDKRGLFGYAPLLQDLEARRVREAALREALIRRLNRGEANVYDDDNGVIDKRNVAALARAGELRGSATNAKRNVAALLRQSKYGSPASSEATASHPEEDEDEVAFAGNGDDAERPEKRLPIPYPAVAYPDWSEEATWTDYDDEGLGMTGAPVKRFLGRIPNMGRHRPKQTSGGSGIKTSRRRPHSS